MNINEFEINYFLVKKDIEKGNIDQAIEGLETLLYSKHDPNVLLMYSDHFKGMFNSYYDLMFSKGQKFLDNHLYRAALSCFSKLLAFQDSSILYEKISMCFLKLGFIDLAEMYCTRSEWISPTDSLLDLKAEIEYYEKNYCNAVAYLEKATAFNRTPERLYKLATYKIAKGDFKSGFSLYESRFEKEKSPAVYPDLGLPRWNKSMENKNLLVHWEQGFGDTIMMSRFLPLLKLRCNKLYLSVRESMVTLMKENFPFAEVISDESIPEDADAHLPMMSIISALDLSVSDVSGLPYLNAERIDVSCEKKKVGISWQGAASGMPERNMTLLDFEPLLTNKAIQLYSFQKGLGLSQALPLFSDLGIVDLGSKFEDFYSTASYLKSMDLFVTTDNCLANLAGALGVPTLLLLSYVSEFRWMDATRDTIWYDSVRIIKQKDFGDWSSCVKEAESVIFDYIKAGQENHTWNLKSNT